jgi:hypothetical protein
MATVSAQATPAHDLSRSSRIEAARLLEGSPYEIPRGNVITDLNYFSPPEDGSVPFNYVEQPPEGKPVRNFGDYDQPVNLIDIRGNESSYTLDKDAFAIVSGVPESAEKDFQDDASIEKNYYPEVEKLILDHVEGANRVIFFDHTIRRTAPESHRAPVTRVHIDQTAKSAKERVIHHAGAAAEKLLEGRYRIINIWRPLNGPIASFPLAYASSASVTDDDVIPVEHIYPDRIGQTAGVKYNERHAWHYLSGIRNDERIFLECFDSDVSKPGSKVQGGRAPHTAFVDPRTPENAPGRESIEVRALVFGP